MRYTVEGMQRAKSALIAGLVLVACVLFVPSTKFKNCDALKAKYPKGVAVSKAKAGTTGATVSKKIYDANRGLDRDKDGIACES